MTHGIPTTDAPPPEPRVRTGSDYGRPPRKHAVYTHIDMEVVTTDIDEVESRIHRILKFIRELGFKVHEVSTRDFDKL